MLFHRRGALTTGAVAFAFAGLRTNTAKAAEETYVNQAVGYGPLVPGQFDGMACFALEGSRVALVRNHELKGDSRTHAQWGPGGFNRERIDLIDKARAYDTYKDGIPLPGGTTTVVYDLKTRETVRQHLSLIGTSTNCCGGATPWGSWLTCEETEIAPATHNVMREHGYVFEVPAAATGLVDPVPLKAMGRFDHEAVCVDPRTGIVYLTEDKEDGLFYRFIPTTPGKLAEGGKLQALVIKGAPGVDTSNNKIPFWAPGDWREVEWIDLKDVESPNADLRMRGRADGAAIFNGGEGIHFGTNEMFFTAKDGGAIERGQIFRYVPPEGEKADGTASKPGRVQLFVESADEKTINMGDNLTVAPWGHLIVCEDNYSADIKNHLKGVTPDGRLYTIGRNVFRGNSELAGCCFSPDASVLFVNIQYPGVTLAIRGPWESVRS